jgi:hypothetical protein
LDERACEPSLAATEEIKDSRDRKGRSLEKVPRKMTFVMMTMTAFQSHSLVIDFYDVKKVEVIGIGS